MIKQLPVSHTALSPDWKYDAGFHGVGEIDSGKPLISVPDREYRGYAFSPDSTLRNRAPMPTVRAFLSSSCPAQGK